MENQTYNYNGTEVSLKKSEYRNGTVALVMNDQDGELYAVATVNLCHPLQSDCLAFLDENNLPGIGDWITIKGLRDFPMSRNIKTMWEMRVILNSSSSISFIYLFIKIY